MSLFQSEALGKPNSKRHGRVARKPENAFLVQFSQQAKASIMVDKDYMVARPPYPAPWKLFLDITVIPLAIDAFGILEAGLEQIGVQGRKNPGATVGIAFGFGCVAAFWLRRT